MRRVVLGTRGSDLARWQTAYVERHLRAAHPALETEVMVISTKGDRVLDVPLPLVGGKGLFTAELESALRGGQIDIAVHSLKDLPTADPDGLLIGAIPQRENPADALVSRAGHTFATLPPGAVVGTSSRRRAAQILAQRPDLALIDIRGNVDTRVRKALDPAGPYDAVVLACAGLLRLGLDGAISEELPFDVMLPAPGQGALGIQCRADLLDLLRPLHDTATAQAVLAERAFLAGLGGGCSVPVAAYAQRIDDGRCMLTGRVCAPDGSRRIDVHTHFDGADALDAGTQLAALARAQGADELLEGLA